MAAAAGSVVSFDAEVLEDNVSQDTDSHSVVIEDIAPLRLAVDAQSNPVAPSSNLTFVLTFGNRGDAAAIDSELVFTLPEGTAFASASGGGLPIDNTVVWDLETLGAGLGGRREVAVAIDADLTACTILNLEPATLSGEIRLLDEQARAKAATRVGTVPPLSLAIVPNPDGAVAGELLPTQLTVTNRSSELMTGTTIALHFPVGLDGLFDNAISDGGRCTSTDGFAILCISGEVLIWNLGNLAPGGGRTVSLPPVSSASDGELIAFVARAFADGTATVWERRTIVADSGRSLTLAVDPLADPVAPGSALTYVLTFGNAGENAATRAELAFPLPAGTSFARASGAGLSVGNAVVWDLETLAAGQGGRREVTVTVDAGVAGGSILEVAPATLSGEIGRVVEQVRATTATRVEPNFTLALAIAPVPDVAKQGETLSTDLTVSNLSGASANDVTLNLLYPEHLAGLSNVQISNDGACTNATSECNSGETVIWDIGTLFPGEDATVSLPPVIQSGTNGPADGELIRFFSYALDSSLNQAVAFSTVLLGTLADNDGDGLDDEIDTDDDNDGLPDVFEIENDLNHQNGGDAALDPDNDGLDNLGEFNHGTDPNNPDTDGDGIRDGVDPQRTLPSNACNGRGANVVFENMVVANGSITTCAAAGSIDVEPAVVVQNGGTLALIAPVIRLAEGFALPIGARLTTTAANPGVRQP